MLTKTIVELDAAVRNIREQRYYEGCEKFKKISEDAVVLLAQNGEEYIVDILNPLYKASENNDFILFADLLESVLIEELKALVKDEVIHHLNNEGYVLERTALNTYTIKIKNIDGKCYYIHSNNNPIEEGINLAKSLFLEKKDEKMDRIAVFGLGLGYHIKALLELTDYAIPIKIYEPSKCIIDSFEKYGIFDKKYIDVCYDPLAKSFMDEYLIAGTRSLILHSEIELIEDEISRRTMQKMFALDNGIKNQSLRMAINYSKNIRNINNCADKLLDITKDKTAIVVAAGPSLDKTVTRLKNIDRSKAVILAVGTVAKKLLANNIYPDAIFFLDAQGRTYNQLNGIEEEIPIVIASTANWRFAEYYSGPKYIAFQNGYIDAEKEAMKRGYHLFNTGLCCNVMY